MNKYFFILILFLYKPGVSQDYIPFPTSESNPVWSDLVIEDLSYPYPQPDKCHTTFYGLRGDTIFEDLIYSKLYKNNPYAVNPDPEFNIETADYVGAIREDDDKKVWYRHDDEEYDVLLYDFSLEVGDTFCFEYFPDYSGCYQVSDVNYVEHNDILRKSIGFMLNGGEMTWIEGIGSNLGWFVWPMYGNFFYQLRCFEQDEELLYGTESCFCNNLNTSVKSTHNQNYFQLDPNPATDFIYIKTTLNEPATIEIYDLQGRKVIEKSTVNKKEKIDVSNLKSGLYIINLNSRDGRVKRKKMVKH